MKTGFFYAALVGLLTFPALSGAAEFKQGAIEIAQPWTRATPKGAQVAGGYARITNTGTDTDRLIGGQTPVAGRLEIHEMLLEQGIMKMRPLPNGVELKPGQVVELKPGGLHFMLLDLKAPLEKGQRVKASLVFEKAGRVEIELDVEALGATKPSH